VPHAEKMRGSFWWKDVLKQVDNFRGVFSINPGKGDLDLFWLDNLQSNGSTTPFQLRFPRLFSYVLDEHASASKVFLTEDLSSLFHLPLSRAACDEFHQMQAILQDFQSLEQNDVWTYCWGDKYSAACFYSHIHSHIVVPNMYH
jgi:hypothetical protein